ncbi:hypothetical protein [Variovorax sp. 278MFTsu5.1]|uniref:hypothetical protein n=1 Tax=Variovorax sp. 278MFTsu5.1 TaxID=3158366 RepID=UPI003AAFC8CF
MTKAEMVARALELKLGEEPSLKSMSNSALEALLKENDPTPGRAATESDKGVATGKGDDPRTGIKKRCRIEVGSGPDGKFDVFGSVNGFNFVAKRGKEIELDTGFIAHLRSLYVTEFSPVIENGKETGEYTSDNIPRFNVVELE